MSLWGDVSVRPMTVLSGEPSVVSSAESPQRESPGGDSRAPVSSSVAYTGLVSGLKREKFLPREVNAVSRRAR